MALPALYLPLPLPFGGGSSFLKCIRYRLPPLSVRVTASFALVVVRVAASRVFSYRSVVRLLLFISPLVHRVASPSGTLRALFKGGAEASLLHQPTCSSIRANQRRFGRCALP